MQTLSATQAFRVRLTGRPLRAGLSGFAPSRLYPDTIRRLLTHALIPASDRKGRWCTWQMEVELAPAPNCYALAR